LLDVADPVGAEVADVVDGAAPVLVVVGLASSSSRAQAAKVRPPTRTVAVSARRAAKGLKELITTQCSCRRREQHRGAVDVSGGGG
jgi:hypothetical protein